MTKEEFEALLASKPEVQNVVVEALKGKGMNVLSPEDHSKFVEQERERIAREKTSEIYSNLDKDFFEASGLAKEGSEKTYDYGKRVVTTYKTQAEQLAQKIADLQEEIKTKGADPTLKAQLEGLQQKEADWSKKENDYKQQLFEKDVNFELTKGLAGFKPKAGIPEDLMKLKIETEKGAIIKSARLADNGQVIYVDGEGKTILNKELQPADATYILNERLKEYADTGRQQTGAGTGSQSGTGGTGAKVLPEGLKTKVAVSEELKKMGVLDGDPEYTKLFNEYLEKHPNLPLR